MASTMANRYDLVKDINVGPEHKVWKIKTRVIRLWRVTSFTTPGQKPPIEMVLLDEQSHRVQCTIKSCHVPFFEKFITEGNVYVMSNLAVALNSMKYKPTDHEFRIFFKRDTSVSLIEDSEIPNNGFSFVPYTQILNEKREDNYLVDVIGLLTGKGDMIEFLKDGKPSNYLVIELDDLRGGDKLRCTLWQDFAHQLIKYLNENSSPHYIVVLQLEKLKMFKGVMGVSNANFTSKLFINEDFPEVKHFAASLEAGHSSSSQQLTPLVGEQSYSLEEDFLFRCVYKPISDLKDLTETAVFVTIGTVKDIESEFSWWYRACKTCYSGLRQMGRKFYCAKCDRDSINFTPRYNIHLRVVDDTDSASFILFDREACKILNKSCSDLRLSYISKGGDKNSYPDEINQLKDKMFLFKVQVKIHDFNSIDPYVIQVVKLGYDESLIAAFQKKYTNVSLSYINESSELLSQITEPIEMLKENISQSYDNTSELSTSTSVKPTKVHMLEGCSGNEIQSLRDDSPASSSKMRKIIKEE